MNQNGKGQRAEIKIFRGVGYLLLVAAAFCTMVPLLWLLTSSFKTANEIFAVPIQWFPSFPPRVASSPYIVEDAYPKIEKPEMVDDAVWEGLQPVLTQAIWTRAEGYIAARFSNYVPSEKIQTEMYVSSEKLQTEMTEGLWQQLAASLPNEIWHETTASIVNTVQDAVIPETIETIWSSVYREVAIGTLQIEDLNFNRPEIGPVAWKARIGTHLRPSADPQAAANLSYEFRDDKTVRMTTTVFSPIPIQQIRRIILPVRGDASYHHLNLTVVVLNADPHPDIMYQTTRPFVFESALWKDAVWRLHGIPGELESSHIPMQQVKTDFAAQPAAEMGNNSSFLDRYLLLQLTIHQPSYLSIVWDKFTSNYRNLWKTVPYNRYFINSVFIATASTLLTLFFCSLGGYAFAKYQFRGQKILFGILLASMMVPFQVLLVPLFGLMYDMGWLNSYKAIIIPFSVGAFGVFLMRQFIITIPSELIDAARIDGCSEFGIYYRIVLPIIKPALGALTIYSFLGSWNGYLWPLIILRDEAKYTLPIGLANLVGIYRQDYGMLMAGTLLSLMPIVILFLAMQREFVQGITLGSVKE